MQPKVQSSSKKSGAMGCGASKAALVADADITIKDYPLGPSSRGAEEEEEGLATGDVLPGNSSGGIERAMREIVGGVGSPPSHPHTLTPTHPIGQPSSTSTTDQQRLHQQQALLSEATPKPVSFEVNMSHYGNSQPKGLLPRRLSQLDSAPKLTPESLAQKQLDAGKRKKKELEKKAHGRLSRTEKLAREVLDARESERAQKQSSELERKQSSGSANRSRLQAEKIGRLRMKEVRSRRVRENARRLAGEEVEVGSGSASLDPSEDIEVDATYNTDEQTGFWESNSSESVGRSEHSSRDWRHRSVAGEEDDGFFGNNDVLGNNNSSSNNLEEYM